MADLHAPPSLKDQGYFLGRYLVASLCFLSTMFNYMLRVNINFAITAMVAVKSNATNSSSTNGSDTCGFQDIEEHHTEYDGEFEWDEWTQGIILGSFSWGYIITQIPGGRLAEKVGPRLVIGICLTFTALLNFLIPVAAHAGYGVLIAVRVLMGLAEGATFPALSFLIANWSPPNERSMFNTFTHIGAHFGIVLTYPFAALMIQHLGWEYAFYIPAAVTLLWSIAWYFFVTDSPKDYPWMSNTEREYILSSLGTKENTKLPPIPVRAIVTSLPVWALIIAGFGDGWGFYTLLTDLPQYMKTMLNKDIKSNALSSALPYLGFMAMGFCLSIIGDMLRQRGAISTQTFRKFATTLAHMGPAVCLFILTWLECDRAAISALLIAALAMQGATNSGYIPNVIDIAPNFAGTVQGISNMFGNTPGFLAPMTVGALTNNNQTLTQWNKVFYITAGIYAIDATFFLIFASGTAQPWNYYINVKEDAPKKRRPLHPVTEDC
ncbi:unnamed protein product [Meganyctiphanes norvegica]|uniref:Major facilitator superfamily (MFS) profile domain-containing protein n=1 Tax=Meganyctiphanes norvegica TaxID=48144 RepID=A0AAV2RZ19_MEGNR